MVAIQSFREQHNELVQVVTEISGYLDGTKLQDDAQAVSSLLNKLTGKLKIHLRMEDTILYPQMINSSHDVAAKTAKQFQEEMGGLSKVYLDYAEKWNAARKIQGDLDGFLAETKQVFAALAQRIERENNDLYPLAEKI